MKSILPNRTSLLLCLLSTWMVHLNVKDAQPYEKNSELFLLPVQSDSPPLNLILWAIQLGLNTYLRAFSGSGGGKRTTQRRQLRTPREIEKVAAGCHQQPMMHRPNVPLYCSIHNERNKLRHYTSQQSCLDKQMQAH